MNPALPQTPESEPSFASVLDRLMASRGLSQAALARGLGVWDANVGRWRKGGGIEIDNVRKIAAYFGVDAHQLEELAGYRDSSRPGTNDSGGTDDPEINALLDAERAQAHADLQGVEPQFWDTIMEASRVARQAAAKIARMATGPSISASSGQPNSANAHARRQLKKGRAEGRGSPKPGGYLQLAHV